MTDNVTCTQRLTSREPFAPALLVERECGAPATVRMLWPGSREWRPVCEHCARKARALAEVMGFRLATKGVNDADDE